MKKTLFLFLYLCFCWILCISVYAHGGRTDAKGGHYNRSTGEYHYHHGYSAHNHYDMDGDGDKDCPYDFKDNTEKNTQFDAPFSSSTEASTPIFDTIFFYVFILWILMLPLAWIIYFLGVIFRSTDVFESISNVILKIWFGILAAPFVVIWYLCYGLYVVAKAIITSLWRTIKRTKKIKSNLNSIEDNNNYFGDL